MRFLIILVVMGCTPPEPFVPVVYPTPEFDWRVYNGPSYNTPYVRVVE